MRERWNEVRQYKLYISFTINNEKHSVLEHGIESTIAERIDQIHWIADQFVNEFKQDLNTSLTIRVDPIVMGFVPITQIIFH